MYWPKTTHIYSLMILMFRFLKWVSVGHHQGIGKDALLLESLGKNLFSVTFHLQEAVCMVVPSSIFKAKSIASSNLSLSLTLLSSLLLLLPSDYIGSTWIIQKYLLVSMS